MSVVDTKPRYFRAGKAPSVGLRIERFGGYDKQGIIRDVSVITRGEALGHRLWVDAEFLQQVADAINQPNKGVKSRFTHPSMSGDGLGRFVGRIMNARVVGDQVLADQHFSQAGHRTTDPGTPDLATYLMDLAETDPEAYGLSIVFAGDELASEDFQIAHSLEGRFQSPDPLNEQNLPHARLAKLHAVDAVDEPAANPGGLFHARNPTLDDAELLAEYALGLADDRPDVQSLDLDPDRVRGFVARFLASRNLTLNMEAKPMALDSELVTTEDTQPVADPIEPTATDTVDAKPAPSEPDAPAEAAPAEQLRSGLDFYEKFGERGAVWYVQGKTWDEAHELYTAELAAENASLKQRLQAAEAAVGETDPLSFSTDEDGNKSKRRGLEGHVRILGKHYE